MLLMKHNEINIYDLILRAIIFFYSHLIQPYSLILGQNKCHIPSKTFCHLPM